MIDIIEIAFITKQDLQNIAIRKKKQYRKEVIIYFNWKVYRTILFIRNIQGYRFKYDLLADCQICCTISMVMKRMKETKSYMTVSIDAIFYTYSTLNFLIPVSYTANYDMWFLTIYYSVTEWQPTEEESEEEDDDDYEDDDSSSEDELSYALNLDQDVRRTGQENACIMVGNDFKIDRFIVVTIVTCLLMRHSLFHHLSERGFDWRMMQYR